MPSLPYLGILSPDGLRTRVVRRDPAGIVIPERAAYCGTSACPADRAHVVWDGERYPVKAIALTSDGQHLACNVKASPGEAVTVTIDIGHRERIGRVHTALHAAQGLISQQFSTVAVREVSAQLDMARLELIGVDENSRAALNTFEVWLNEKLQSDLHVRTYLADPARVAAISSCASAHRLVEAGQTVHVVEIEGLHTQKCSAPHLPFTGDVGYVRVRFDEMRDGAGVVMLLDTDASGE